MVLIFKEHAYIAFVPDEDDPEEITKEERTHFLQVPGEYDDRDATKQMLAEDEQSTRFAIYEPTGALDDDGLVPGFALVEIVKVTANEPTPAASLRKVG